jgi:hypothetical protein
MGTTGKARQARRVGLALAATLCLCAIGASAAAAQAPLGWSGAVQSDSSAGAKGITAISCPAVTLCVAVDGNGNVLYSTSPASGSWSVPVLMDSGHAFTGVSCPSTTLCFATDNHGSVYSSTAPATATPWTPEQIGDGTTQLNAIACPSSGLCVVVDNSGAVLTSATPGTAGSPSWTKTTVDASNHITAVSCPTTALCVATDNLGNALIPAAPTSSTWPQTQLTGDVALQAISCDSSAACVLTASDGTVYDTADIAGATVTWSWTAIDGANALTAASCTDVGLCLVGDGVGNVFQSDNAESGQPVWSSTTISSGHSVTALACLSAGLCVATDNHGDTIAATLPAPVVATGAGSAPTQTAATLAATVNPNDATLSDCHFDYGVDTTYGSSVPCTVVPSATGGAQAVTASLSGLNASTTYHFRVVASSGVATSDGADATFTTPAPLKPSPSISGTPAVGNTLTCKDNVTTTAAETVSYQWTSDTTAIPGATSPTYVVAPTDQGHHISCSVTISGDGGSATAISGFDGVPSQAGGTITESFVGTDKRGADSVSAPVTCSPQAVGGCTIALALVGIKTAHHRSQNVAVGSLSTKLAAGASRVLTVSLNATGRQLLRKQHALVVTLTVSGTVIGTLKATLQTDKLVFTQKGKLVAKRQAR